jgi:hypothetical protein
MDDLRCLVCRGRIHADAVTEESRCERCHADAVSAYARIGIVRLEQYLHAHARRDA